VLIKPGKDWQWIFCPDKDRLTLDLGADMVFVSAFSARSLVAGARKPQIFSIEQSQSFYHYIEQIDQQLSLPEDVVNHIALNAIAAKDFYKALTPKSWFFNTATSVSSAQTGKIVLLQSQHETRHYLIVESNTKASTLLLIERCHQLSEGKSLDQFGLIKVMNDRLMPVPQRKAATSSAA